jgi:cytochrome c
MSLSPQFLKSLRSAATGSVVLTALFMPQASAQGQNAEKAASIVAKGEYLAQARDCVACHTAPGGKLFAGGRAMPTPFGTLYTSNVTPDRDTGIGKWTADQFYSMMHTGRSPDGGLLYPAMPFASYTKVTRADSDAIFAFMQSVAPVKQPNKPHDLKFPYNNRSLIIGWRTLFFTEGEYKPDSTRSAAVRHRRRSRAASFRCRIGMRRH